MEGGRGQEKNPGEIRTSQNWIDGAGSSLKTARFIPPNLEDLQRGLQNLEEYINEEFQSDDPLIRAALIHYQFETLHPFLDGNGRIGRMLISLYLMEQKVITVPLLYPSLFLKINKVEYFDRMTEVRNSGNYEQWVLFFLTAIEQSAEDAIEIIGALNSLHKENIQMIQSSEKSNRHMTRLLEIAEQTPKFGIKYLAEQLVISEVSASKVIQEAISLGILNKIGDGKRNQQFSYTKYLDILRNGTE